MNSSQKKLKLALIQMRCTEDRQKNLKHAITLIHQAADQGAQIVCLQELFSGLYFCQSNDRKFFDWAEPVPGPTSVVLSQVAKEKQIVIVASLFEKDQNNFYNTACVLDADGSFLGKYRKVHIPDDPDNYYSELFYFKPGDLGIKPFQTRYAKIGVQICWDQWFPEGARSLALQGAEIIFYPTAIGWPVSPPPPHPLLTKEGDGGRSELSKTEYEAWTTVQRGHAISNTVFVAATNRTGLENHLNFWGGSFVCDPLGRMLSKASHDQEEILLASCDLGRLEEVRKDWPFLTCRRTEQYFL